MKGIIIRLYQVCVAIPLSILLLVSTAISFFLFLVYGIVYWIITATDILTPDNFERVLDTMLRICTKLMLKDHQ